MEGRIKTRVPGSVPNTLGRQVGVLPVGPRPPRIQRRIPSVPDRSSPIKDGIFENNVSAQDGLVRKKTSSSDNHTLRKKSTPSPDTVAKTRVRGQPHSRNSSAAGFQVDEEDSEQGQDVKFFNVPSSRSSSGISRGDVPNSRSSSAVSRGDETERKAYKTIVAEEVLAQCQETDPLRVYDVNLHACDITTIENLESFKKLRVLDLSCNYIEKIQNLHCNTDLRELKLYDNRIRTVEYLVGLKELCSLQLQHNKIKSLGKGLTTLKKLKTLRVDCNQILKIETGELSCCSQITVIDVSYNMLDNLTALNYLPNLEELSAAGNRLRTVSDLTKCRRLKEVDLSRNRLSNLSGLKGLPVLQILNVSDNQLANLKSVGKLKSLQEIHASNNSISELSSLSTQFPQLEILVITDNVVRDWDELYSLEGLENLVELFINGNPFLTENGPRPHYYADVQSILPGLEILDGAHIKKHTAKGAPLMRPMSASTIVSVRQLEAQMKAADDQMAAFEKSISDRFDSVRTICNDLPAEPPSARASLSALSLKGAASPEDSTPVSRCNSRLKIKLAQQYAAENF